MLSRVKYYEWLNECPQDYCAFCEWKKTQDVVATSKYFVWHLSMSPLFRYHTMLTPKRHCVTIQELTGAELKELIRIQGQVIDLYRKSGLKDLNGNPYKRYEMLWRVRDETHDPITGNVKPDHFHLNIDPFMEHNLDASIQRDAHLFDFRDVLKEQGIIVTLK